MTRAAHDPDALDVVVKTICYLIRGGDSRFRTAEAVRAKVDAIMANMVELRAAVKGDKALLPDSAARPAGMKMPSQTSAAVESHRTVSTKGG